MKLYAIEVTEEAKDFIPAISDVDPRHVARYLDMDDPYYLIASHDGIFHAICWIDAESFEREFKLEQPLIAGEFTLVTEL